MFSRRVWNFIATFIGLTILGSSSLCMATQDDRWIKQAYIVEESFPIDFLSQSLWFEEGEILVVYQNGNMLRVAVEDTDNPKDLKMFLEINLETIKKDQVLKKIELEGAQNIGFQNLNPTLKTYDQSGEATKAIGPRSLRINIDETKIIKKQLPTQESYQVRAYVSHPEFQRDRNSKKIPSGFAYVEYEELERPVTKEFRDSVIKESHIPQTQPISKEILDKPILVVDETESFDTEGNLLSRICEECSPIDIKTLPLKPEVLSKLHPQFDWDHFKQLVFQQVGRRINNCNATYTSDIESSPLLSGLREMQMDIEKNSNFTKQLNLVSQINEKIQRSDDVLAVDVCARTCVVEMGGAIAGLGNLCRQDDRYLQGVVGTIHHRKELAFGNDAYSPQLFDRDGFEYFASPTDDPLLKNPYMNVMLKSEQYSVWNLWRNNSNQGYRRALCPPAEEGQNFYAGNGKSFPASSTDAQAFNSCRNSCFDMVFRPEKFIDGKEKFKAAYYTSFSGCNYDKGGRLTSNNPPNCTKFHGMPVRSTPPSIDGKSLTAQRCMTFYNDQSIFRRSGK